MIDAVAELSLFDLDYDPGEATNVASENPIVVSALVKCIERAGQELKDIGRTGSGARICDSDRRKLQVLLTYKAKRTSNQSRGNVLPAAERPMSSEGSTKRIQGAYQFGW